MRTFIFGLIAAIMLASPIQAEGKKEERTIEIYMQQQLKPNYKTRFYMWIKEPDAMVLNSAPNIDVGYSFGGGGAIYLESKHVGNAMFFVHPFSQRKDKSWPGELLITFGPLRDNDIHIWLPEGTKAKVQVSSIDHTKPQKDDDED